MLALHTDVRTTQNSLDLVDAPQVRVDARLPAGAARLVGLDHLPGQPERHQLLGRRLVWAAALADRGGELGENFGEWFCPGDLLLCQLRALNLVPVLLRVAPTRLEFLLQLTHRSISALSGWPAAC